MNIHNTLAYVVNNIPTNYIFIEKRRNTRTLSIRVTKHV